MKSKKHSMDFFKEKYQEIKEFAIDKGVDNPYRDLDSFIDEYEMVRQSGTKNVMKEIKYYTQYETSYKTARAMLAKAREFGGEEKLKDLKNMSTRVFAEKYLTELKAEQEEAKLYYGDDYMKYIGITWFNSSGE